MTSSEHIAYCHALLDQNPQDWDTRLRLADLLIELGDEDGAACQRWIVEERQLFFHRGVWSWLQKVASYAKDSLATYQYRDFETRLLAEGAAWDWYKQSKLQIRIEGP